MEISSMSKKTTSQASIAIIVLLVAILVVISGWGGYFLGRKVGRTEGAKTTVSEVTDLLNPVKAISSNPAFPYTTLGTVVSVNDSSMKLKLADGTEKEIMLSDKTNVTKGSTALKVSDIKKDNKVTAFTSGKGKDQLAVRVIIR